LRIEFHAMKRNVGRGRSDRFQRSLASRLRAGIGCFPSRYFAHFCVDGQRTGPYPESDCPENEH